MKTIALQGGSYNPPGVHHERISAVLAKSFDRVVVVPCGQRPDKSVVGSIDPRHRLQMAELAFNGIAPNVELDLSDVLRPQFTRTIDLYERYRTQGDVFLVIGGDLIKGGATGESEIHQWYQGLRLWEAAKFAVVLRAGVPFNKADLPSKNFTMPGVIEGSSTDIRDRLKRGEPITGLVSSAVERYIHEHHLYAAA